MFGEDFEFDSAEQAGNDAGASDNNVPAAGEEGQKGTDTQNGEGADGVKNTDEGAGDGTGNNEGDGPDGSSDSSDKYIELRINDNEVRSLNRDEAMHYAQRGVELEGVYQKLDYLATAQGVSVDDYLKNQLDAREQSYRAELETRVTDKDALEELMGLYRTREKEKYEQAILGRKKAEETARQTRESKIAEDFLKLQKEFPEVSDYKSLPNSVKSAAAKGEDLLSAYLLHRHREGQAVKKAEESAKAAAAASAGSMQSVADISEESFSDFKKALFGN